MYHGNAIISAIRNSSVEIHTYNDGLAASMSADIWLSAPNRHMASNAILMIHAAIGLEWGNAKQLRKAAEVADKYTQTAAIVGAESTGMTVKAFNEMFYDDYDDHYLTHTEVKELNFITDDEEYDAESTIQNIDKMKFMDIMKHFASTEDDEATGLLQQIQSKFNAVLKTFNPVKLSHKNSHDMKLEDLNKSLKDGDLSIEDLQKAIDDSKTPPEAPPVVPPVKKTADTDVDLQKMVNEAVTKATQPLTEKITAQAAEIDELNAKPGAGITKPAAKDGDDFSDGDGGQFKELDDFNATMRKSATEDETVSFV